MARYDAMRALAQDLRDAVADSDLFEDKKSLVFSVRFDQYEGKAPSFSVRVNRKNGLRRDDMTLLSVFSGQCDGEPMVGAFSSCADPKLVAIAKKVEKRYRSSRHSS